MKTRTADDYSRLVNSVGGIFWEAEGKTFRFLFVSPQAEQMLGYPVREWLEDPDFWRRHTHPEDVEWCAAFCRDAMLAGRDHTFEYRMIAADGHVVWLRDVVTVGYSGDGSVVLRGIMIDISDRKAAEDAAIRSHRLYRSLLENSSDNIVLLSATGTTVYANAALERQLGYRPEELIGRNNFHLVHSDDLPVTTEAFERILSSDTVVGPFRFRFRHKDGSWRVIETLGKRFIDESGEAFVIINNRDITDVVQAAEALRESEDRRKILEEQVHHAQKLEAVGQLAGGVAHDFNNLLTVVAGYCESLRSVLPLSSPLLGDVDEIQRAADRATMLTHQLLAFSRKQVVQAQHIDLNATVRDMARMLERVLGEDVTLELALDGQAPIVADPGQIEQVLMNLALNSRDAMPLGGTLAIATAAVTLDERAAALVGAQASDYIRLTIRDTGVGMTPEVKERVFEPFFTTKDPGKGTGLGLSTVYGIVSKSGGRVSLTSQVGQGTTFTIHLPRAAALEARPARSAAVATATGGAEIVLLVEDDPNVRNLARHALERSGYQVLCATDPANALQMCHTYDGRIDLLLTDVVMSGMAGPELAARAEALRPHLKVLYMSGYTGDAILRRGVSEEGVSFIQKPFAIHDFLNRVREILDLH